jgi:leucyl aminopeptidase
MKAIIKNTFERLKGTVIIPVVKNQSLAKTLDNIAREFNLTSERIKGDLKGDLKEFTCFYIGETKIYLLGLGDKPNAGDTLAAFRAISFQQKTKFGENIAIDFTLSNISGNEFLEAAINGFALGIYRIGLYKSEPNGIHPLSNDNAILTIFIKKDIKTAQNTAGKAILTAETQIRIMDLVNSAPNKKTPQYLADWAAKSGEANGFNVIIFDKKQCEDTGLHALLSVNQGSDHEPRFIIMEYKPTDFKGGKDEKLPKVGLVGKGITFDTGGISLKPSNNMHLMKSDMGGAAAVLGTMELVAKLKLRVHLIGIVPSTENMVDGKGTKPGDVIKSYFGKTIEVIDTDAEGRLVLADGLTYMKKNFKPDTIIDLATLTGSIVSTLGYNAAGLFSNNDALANALTQAGDATGERIWRLPIWDIYMDDMKSDVADISNLSSKPMAGAITAAKFLEYFIDGHTKWAHLDIAGVALATNELGLQRVATGYGIRLLTNYIETLSV